MKKGYAEEYEWEIEMIGFNKDNKETERFCRNGKLEINILVHMAVQ